MKRQTLVAAMLGLLLAACSATPAPTRVPVLPVPTASPTETPAVGSLPRMSQAQRTPESTATVRPAPTATSTAVVTSSPDPTPTPQPEMRQLTSGGCCTRPFWSADSRYVQFIDRPASRPSGIYGVDVERGGPPTLLTEWIVSRSGDGAFYVYPGQDTTIVQRVVSGEKYVIANGGRPVSVSPDGQRLLWQVTEQSGGFDRRRGQIWVANVDGTAARILTETVGLGQSQWIDKGRILLVGGPLENLPYVSIAALTLGAAENDDRRVELAQVVRPRGALVSPEGNWLVYYLTFQPNADDDGLWIVPTDASQPPRKLDFFGSYRWRDDTHLLYVPLEPGVESHTLWEYDLAGAESRRLTDPAWASFKIANNDWSVSPDGRYVVFVDAADHNLWLIELSPSDS